MKKITILIPVYNDWQSVSKLLNEINTNVKGLDFEFSIIVINDASTEAQSLSVENLDNLKSVRVMNMKENRGHARCIATGLKYVFDNEEFDYVIPMDGDGEDRPEEIKFLIEEANYSPDKAIVGERIKRSENLIFKVSYSIHKLITYTFTGQSIKFGNFTCLPKSTVEKMIKDKATWSSFSGALTKVEKNIKASPSTRGIRYFGPSKMNFLNLVKHSLAIIAVFKVNVIFRAALFYAIYLYLISSNITVVTLIPLVLIIVFIISVLTLSKREDLNALNNSTNNLASFDKIK
jgi:glycosyltransferase involved in cell wall biosynthesis